VIHAASPSHSASEEDCEPPDAVMAHRPKVAGRLWSLNIPTIAVMSSSSREAKESFAGSPIVGDTANSENLISTPFDKGSQKRV
jgi:hypothetical protein